MYTFQVPLLLCLVCYTILSIGLAGVSVDGSKFKKISRVARNACGEKCPGDNFDIHAYYCDENLNECCRVCRKGQYKSSNCWYDNVNHHEYKYNCSYCEEGFYQQDYNIETECKKCPPPSITCQPGEKIHCDRETAEYSCQEDITTPEEITTVPELSTATSEAGSGTKAESQKSGTDRNGLSVGEIFGIIIAVLVIIAVSICVIIWYRTKWKNKRPKPKKDDETVKMIDTENGGAAPTTNDVRQEDTNKDEDDQTAGHSGEDDQTARHSGEDDQSARHSDENDQAARHSDEDDQTAQHSGEDDQTAQHSAEDDQTAQHSGEDDQTSQQDVDDSQDYILKVGVTFNDFKLEVAEKLPPNTRNTFYVRLGLERREYERAETDEPGNLLNKINKVLDVWVEKRGAPHGDRVQEVLSALWKHNLKDTRRLIIQECCCKKNSEKANNLSGSPV